MKALSFLWGALAWCPWWVWVLLAGTVMVVILMALHKIRLREDDEVLFRRFNEFAERKEIEVKRRLA